MQLIMDSNKTINQEAGSKRKARSSADLKISDKNPRRTSETSSVGEGSTEEDRRKLEEKRAYNRKNAARARQRTKEHILELTARAERYASKNEALHKANEKLVAEVKTLTEENQRLRQLLNMPGSSNSTAATTVATAPTSLPALASTSGALRASAGSIPPGRLSGTGTGLIDQAALHGPTAAVYFPQTEGSASAQAISDASVAARQRGLLLQLLQGGQGDPSRQGLPPGFNY